MIERKKFWLMIIALSLVTVFTWSFVLYQHFSHPLIVTITEIPAQVLR